MDINRNCIYAIGVLVILCVLLNAAARHPQKGEIGEKKVADILKKLPGDKYRTINNVLLKRHDGKTVQIDHIVVSLYGIFVIETKNYKGIITGNDYLEQWTKHVYKKKYYFFSPTRQNYGHIKALEELLGLPGSCFVSIVVFLPGARLRVKSRIPVIHTKRLKRIIRSYRTIQLDSTQVREIEDRIHHLNIHSKRAEKKHVKRIKKATRK